MKTPHEEEVQRQTETHKSNPGSPQAVLISVLRSKEKECCRIRRIRRGQWMFLGSIMILVVLIVDMIEFGVWGPGIHIADETLGKMVESSKVSSD